eukprot:gene24299-32735_t
MNKKSSPSGNRTQVSRDLCDRLGAIDRRSLTVSADAVLALISVLKTEDDIDGSLNLIISELKERIFKGEVSKAIIDVETITSIVADLSASEEDIANESIQLFDAFDSPKLVFDETQKTFKIDSKVKYSFFGPVESRANMYKERLFLTQQRLLRSGQFSLKGLGKGVKNSSSENKDIHEISTVESLLGSTGTKVLFGIITQLEEGVWYVEDLTAVIPIDLSGAQTYPLFFTEGSQVVMQGELRDGVFRVQVLGLPFAEDRDTSLRALGINDNFGQGFSSAQMQNMQQMEVGLDDAMVVILSDVQLDKPMVLEKLSALFRGFEDSETLPLFVLMGSFLSQPVSRSAGGRNKVIAAFDALAETISSFKRIAESAKFLLIPGPLDVGMGNSCTLPRRSIPVNLTGSLKNKVKHLTLASNPCRLRYLTQEIVFFREDLLQKMQRHLVVPLTLPDDSDDGLDSESRVPDITEQLVESIIDQGHLCPLPLQSRPIYWELDYTLRLFPLPHLLILADHAEHYTYAYQSCKTANPGSFSSDFSFIVYHPSKKGIDFSRVP